MRKKKKNGDRGDGHDGGNKCETGCSVLQGDTGVGDDRECWGPRE